MTIKLKQQAIFLTAFVFLFLAAANLHAAAFTVNNNGDAGDAAAGNGVCETAAGNGICTLRAAVQEANALVGDDSITFAPSVTLVTVTSEIGISSPAGSLTITGNGAKVTTISGGSAANRILNITGATLTIEGVTLSGGRTIEHGAGIRASSGTLTLNAVTVENNLTTTENSGSNGGGVYVTGGTSIITNSTFTNNSAYSCGGFAVVSGTAYISNSTFSDNTARGLVGGGLCTQIGGTMWARNITVTNNRVTGVPFVGANGGGGLRINGTLNIGNSIIAGNTSPAGSGIDFVLDSGTVTSVGGNLIGDNTNAGTTPFSTTGTPNANDDYVGTNGNVINALLAPLAYDLTGQTKVHRLVTGSPAIDHGIDANAVNPFNSQPLLTDQRGSVRIFDGGTLAPLALRVDIGAVEANSPVTSANVNVGGRVLTNEGAGLRNATVYLTDAQGNTRKAQTGSFGNFTFEGIEAGQTVVLTVASKRYSFEARTMQVNDNVTDIALVALP